MKKTAQDFGSHWNRPASRVRTEESAETTCESEDDYLGFRLVHEDDFRQYTGSGYPFSAELVRKQHSGNPIHPLQRGGGMSFRLAHDREDK